MMPGITINPARQLTPNSQVANNTPSESRTRSPHRPTRSIGSSWGFSGVEQDKENNKDVDEDEDDEDEDTTDSDEDEEPKKVTKTNGSLGRSGEANGAGTAASSNSRTAKGKGPTVEELVEDPD